jgi:hypothetical protein
MSALFSRAVRWEFTSGFCDLTIKAFDPAVIAAMKTLATTLDTLKQSAAMV